MRWQRQLKILKLPITRCIGHLKVKKRRVELLDHNFTIRKINQAYFAFHGTYAESPSSTSPIARYLWDLREQVATVGDLVKLLRPLGTYKEFEQLLVDRGIELEPVE